MSNSTAVLLSAVLLVGGTAAAQAISLTNEDAGEVVLEIEEGGAGQTIEVASGQTLVDVCVTPCTITLPSGERMEFEGYETVAIEDGAFVILE